MFDYFYGTNAEQFTFYRIPKVLFTDEQFDIVSCEAKVLYGLMLDRMGLSMKSRWIDQENRVYIIFPVGEIAELLGCCVQKVAKLLDELDEKKGIGLIERKRLGLGKPNRIYVKNFSPGGHTREKEDGKAKDMEEVAAEQEESGETNAEGEVCENQNNENHKSRIMNFINQEFPKTEIQNYENHKSGIMKNIDQELCFSKTNKTNNIKTESSDTENQASIESIYPSIYPEPNSPQKISERENLPLEQETGLCVHNSRAMARDSVLDKKRELVKQAISYNIFCISLSDNLFKLRQVDEMVDLIAEILSVSSEKGMKIGAEYMKAEDIQTRLKELRYEHIEYVLESLEEASRTKKIRNIRAYLLTALYRAPMTIANHYANRAIFDMKTGNNS